MTPHESPRLVLIVEDAELCSSTLEIALQAIPSIQVRSASSGEEAIGILRTERVSALITDLHMPEMGGLELVMRARTLPGQGHLPIVVISGDTDPRTPELVIAAGADAFFLKPYSPAAVRRKVENLICGVESAR